MDGLYFILDRVLGRRDDALHCKRGIKVRFAGSRGSVDVVSSPRPRNSHSESEVECALDRMAWVERSSCLLVSLSF